MMKMLKLLGLMVFVVCIAAFASGCGGGGGGSAMTPEEPPPVMECPQGQVGTYPDCTDPGPTDEQRIAAARQLLADLLMDARSLAQTASSAAAAVQFHPDATAEQTQLALGYAADAQTYLAAVEAARDAGNAAAATLTQAQAAVTAAQAALGNLANAQSAAAGIQSAVEAVASQRQQREADVIALTNGSSLIMELIDNKRVVDAAIDALALTSLVVDPALATATDGATCTAPCALYPADTGTGSTRVTGVRSVQVNSLGSNARDTLTGPSRLQYGFDFKNSDGTTIVNAYTDIQQTKLGDNPATPLYGPSDDDGTDDEKETDHVLNDTDYLLAGIWLTSSGITAFAYGSEPITGIKNFCTVSQNSGPRGSTTRTCAVTEGFGTISSFVVDPGDARTATYRGDANGAYLTGGDTSYFQASVELTAEFQNPASGAATGSIEGTVTNINAGGQSIPGSIELQKVDLADAGIADEFTAGVAGTVGGDPYVGNWKGQFFGLRAKQPETDSDTNDAYPLITTITTTYTPDVPGSVAGTFYATKQTEFGGKAAFIGAFGAHR